MSGYLGKISAIVTANTSDFNNKLSASAKEVRSFAASMQSSITRAQSGATSSLRGIYTEAQKLERALKAASTMSLSFKGFDASKFKNVEEAANQMRRMASAAEQVYKPLQAAAKASESLATEVRAGFQPALVKAQQQAELLNAAITKGMAVSEQSFARVERRVLDTAAAMSRLTEASEIAGSGPRGTELAFADPRARDALLRSAAAREAAAAAPAVALESGSIGEQVKRLAELDAMIERARADVEAAMVLEIDTAPAKARLSDLIATSNTLSDQLSRHLTADVDARRARAELDALVAKLGNIREGVSFAVTGKVQNFDQAEQEFRRLQGVVGGLGAEQSGQFLQPLQRLGELVGTRDKAELAEVARLIDEINEKASGQIKINIEAENAKRKAADLENSIKRLRELADFSITGKIQNADQVEGRLQQILGVMSRLDAASKKALSGSVNSVILNLQNGDISAAIAELQKLEAAVGKLGGRLPAVGRGGDVGRMGVDRFSLAMNQAAFAVDDFFSSTGGIEFKIRAISNNITQLGFILGDTEGLFTALGAVIAAQALIPLVKWIYQTDIAEAKVKALNEALQSQQSAVSDLAAAYKELSRSIAATGSSEAGRKLLDKEKTINDIRDKFANAQSQRVANFSPEVSRIRGERAILEKKLEKEENLEQRLSIQNEIARKKREEQAAIARGARAPSGDEIKSELVAAAGAQVQQTQVRLNRARLRSQLGGAAPPGEDVASVEAELRRRQNELVAARGAVAPAGNEEKISSLRSALGNAEKQRERQVLSGARTDEIDKTIDRLKNTIGRLEASLAPEVQSVVERITRNAMNIADSLASGQKIIEDAFGGNASAIEAEMNRTAEALAMLQQSASEAATPEEAAAFQQDIDALKQHSDELKAAAMAVRSFSDEMNRIAESFSSDVASRQQMAEEARREDLRKGTPESAARRDRAEEEARAATQAEREFKDAQATARERIENDVNGGGRRRWNAQAAARMRWIDEQLAVPANEIGANGIRGGSVNEREKLREERRKLQAWIDESVAASPEVEDQRRRRDEQTRRLERDKEQREQAARGRDLAATPGQRAAKDLNENLESIRQFFGEQAELGNGLVDEKAQREAMQRQIEEARKSVAPMVFDMAQAVENAVLGGPSRAALNASDVTTMEGQKELNRLLRGDDSAKDINLAELQKQTQQLQDLNQGIDDLNAQLAGVAV